MFLITLRGFLLRRAYYSLCQRQFSQCDGVVMSVDSSVQSMPSDVEGEGPACEQTFDQPYMRTIFPSSCLSLSKRVSQYELSKDLHARVIESPESLRSSGHYTRDLFLDVVDTYQIQYSQTCEKELSIPRSIRLRWKQNLQSKQRLLKLGDSLEQKFVVLEQVVGECDLRIVGLIKLREAGSNRKSLRSTTLDLLFAGLPTLYYRISYSWTKCEG